MFTGIVTALGVLKHTEDLGGVLRLDVECPFPSEKLRVGDSIAIAGICFTLVQIHPEQQGTMFSVEASQETISRTTVKHWKLGAHLNLELALAIGDPLGGHLVTGHVDGVAEVERTEWMKTQEDKGQHATLELTFRVPETYEHYVAEKGSIALDGVSLTVNTIREHQISCCLIPHTLAQTTLSQLQPGSLMNFEVDLFSRYIARHLSYQTNKN